MEFSDIEMAFDYVSSTRFGINNAYISRKTGEVYYTSEMYDSDELPDDIDDEDVYVSIPHKNELNLGRQLMFHYIRKFLPDDYETVSEFFSRKGAYSRYKQLLEQRGKLDDWHQFENQKQKEALVEWCKENNLQFET